MQVDLKLSLSTILEIIQNTENPAVATQLIEGSYKEPQIPTSVFNSAKKEICTFKSFNKWTNKVTFSFPKYKYYNAEKKDFNWSPSELFMNKEFYSVADDTMPLESWMTFFNESLEAFTAPVDFAKVVEYADLVSPQAKVVSIPLQD